MSPPLKILKVIDAWKWFAEAEQMFQASASLIARGHAVEVACQPESPAAARARALGIPVHPLPGLRGARAPWTPLLNVWRLKRAIEISRPQLVHAYRSPPHLLAAAAIALSRGPRPGLVRTRGATQSIRRGVLNRWLYEGRTQGLLLTSGRIEADLVAAGFAPEGLRQIPTVIDADPLRGGEVEAFRAWAGLGEGPVIGVLARLEAVKGHLDLMEALPSLLERFPGLSLCFVGPEVDGTREKIVARAGALGVSDRVKMPGASDDPGAALRAFDLVVIPSIGSEEISRVLLEAFSLGRPVVATRVGVIPEIAEDGVSALLVPPRDPAALGAAIRRALGDPGLRAQLGEAGAARYRAAHTPDRLADALEAAYAQAYGRL